MLFEIDIYDVMESFLNDVMASIVITQMVRIRLIQIGDPVQSAHWSSFRMDHDPYRNAKSISTIILHFRQSVVLKIVATELEADHDLQRPLKSALITALNSSSPALLVVQLQLQLQGHSDIYTLRITSAAPL